MIKNVVDWFQNIGHTAANNNTPYSVLFSDGFMREYTLFLTWDEFRSMQGIWLAEQPDEMLFLTEEWNRYVQETTRFTSWEAMLYKAEEQHIMEKPFGPYQMM